MSTVRQLIDAGFQIKATSVLKFDDVVEHHIYFQNNVDAYVVILRRRASDGAGLDPQPQIIRLG